MRGPNIEIEPWQRFDDQRFGIDPSVMETLREALTEAAFVEDEAYSMEG